MIMWDIIKGRWFFWGSRKWGHSVLRSRRVTRCR